MSILLCGSSERMMQGLVLGRTAPLYGRAQEILRLEPQRPGWIVSAPFFARWRSSRRDLILDRRGVLHGEPARLLLDDMRTAGLAYYSTLSLIESGCCRLSEMAGRLGKPAGSLARPLSNPIELGYVRKEVLFGEEPRSSNGTFYLLDDPLLSFFFRFLRANQSLRNSRDGPVVGNGHL